jgi:rhodanese-related sulfurtransferase
MNNISIEELKSKMESGDDFILLDVREPHEYQEFNIGGKLYPLGRIMGMDIEELEDFRTKEIVIHCKSGMRSMQACMMLEQMGFARTANVTGGVLAWMDKYGA